MMAPISLKPKIIRQGGKGDDVTVEDDEMWLKSLQDKVPYEICWREDSLPL